MRTVTTLALIFFVNLFFAQEQASITGNIFDDNNQTIPFASIYIEALNKGTAADENGFYKLENIPSGTWTLKSSAVGYQVAERTVEITADESQVINFTLIFDNQLEQVEVFGNRNDSPDKIESITRLPLKPYEQIQRISVISGRLSDDQGPLAIGEATKHVRGVYAFSSYGYRRDSISSRGSLGIRMLHIAVRSHPDVRRVGVVTDIQGVDSFQM